MQYSGNHRQLSRNGRGKLAKIADLTILVQSESMERIEDAQLVINHIIKEAVKSNNDCDENATPHRHRSSLEEPLRLSNLPGY